MFLHHPLSLSLLLVAPDSGTYTCWNSAYIQKISLQKTMEGVSNWTGGEIIIIFSFCEIIWVYQEWGWEMLQRCPMKMPRKRVLQEFCLWVLDGNMLLSSWNRFDIISSYRSGKSSINRVIFQNMSPHETLFLEATVTCDISNTLSNRLVQFQTWDFGGDVNLAAPIDYMGHDISFDTIFEKSSTLVYVIDAQEDDYEHALPKLAETIHVAYTANPSIHFEVFLHKVDGDFMSEDTKGERKQVSCDTWLLFSTPELLSISQGIQSYLASDLSDRGSGDALVSYHLTSIYDHSSSEAFSKVQPPTVATPKLLYLQY